MIPPCLPSCQADDDDDHDQGRLDPEDSRVVADDVEDDRREEHGQHERRQDRKKSVRRISRVDPPALNPRRSRSGRR
jgi:hypothetical protein